MPYLDADGDPTDPTTPDTERSIDAAAFADCTEEVTTISGSNGMGYITLTGDETNGSIIAVAAKVASGPKNTLAVLYPRVLPVLSTGTAQAGAAGTITLASGAPTIDLSGCIVRTTAGTGAAGGSGSQGNQARMITAYNTSTKVATIVPNWETTPDSTTVYDVCITELACNTVIANVTAFNGVAGTFSAGRPEVNTTHVGGSAIQQASGYVKVSEGTGTGQLDLTSGRPGVDWAKLSNKTTVVDLTQTTISPSQIVASVTGNVGGNITGSIGSLGATALTNVKAQVVAALDTDTYAELTAVPSSTATFSSMLRWVYVLCRNKITEDATTQTLRNNSDAGNIATAAVSDVAGVFTRGKWS